MEKRGGGMIELKGTEMLGGAGRGWEFGYGRISDKG
jgi:hypothetical protein